MSVAVKLGLAATRLLNTPIEPLSADDRGRELLVGFALALPVTR